MKNEVFQSVQLLGNNSCPLILAIKIALIITAISIALLAIYGADAAVGKGTEQGFLPFDHKIRGMALGGPAMIMPIVAFFMNLIYYNYQLSNLYYLVCEFESLQELTMNFEVKNY